MLISLCYLTLPAAFILGSFGFIAFLFIANTQEEVIDVVQLVLITLIFVIYLIIYAYAVLSYVHLRKFSRSDSSQHSQTDLSPNKKMNIDYTQIDENKP